MKRFNVAYIRKNPVMFGVIFVVFGLIVWMLLNRGAQSSGGTTVVSAGPSDAQLAMGTQVQLAQIGAGAAVQQAQIQFAALAQQGADNLSLAQLEASYKTLELASNERVQNATLSASVSALGIQMDTQRAIVDSNNGFMIDYAQVQADAARDQLAIGAALQAKLSGDQLEAFKIGTEASKWNAALSVVPTLKKKDRDNALAGFVGYSIPNDPARTGGGGSLFSSIASFISPALALAKVA